MAVSESNICPDCGERSLYQTACVPFEETHLHRLGMKERTSYACVNCGACYLRTVTPESIKVKSKEPPNWLKKRQGLVS